MNTNLKAAIIGGICVILAPILTLLLNNSIENRKYEVIGNRDILGKWSGIIIQELGNSEISFGVEFEFRNRGRKLYGTCKVDAIDNPMDESHNLYIEGGLFENRFLKLEYKNTDENVIQFGTFLMELMPDGKKLIGRFTGYGHVSKKVVYGKITLNK